MPSHMQLQSAPVPPDVAFFLDAALEHEELDAGSHVALKLYAPRVELMRIVDGEWKLGTGTAPKRLDVCEKLTGLASSIMPELPIETRGAIAHAGVLHMRGQVNTLSWCLGTWAIEDEIQGGCLVPYKNRISRAAHRYELSKKQERRLHAPTFVRRYVKGNDDARRLRRQGSLVISRAAPIPRAMMSDAAQLHANLLAEQLLAAHEGYRRFNQRQISRMADTFIVGRSVTTPASARKFARKQRRVIKRAAVCASSIIGSAGLTAFARGMPVTIEGQSLHLEVARLGSAASTGHGAISVVAVDPKSRRRLADLCVYHEKTPALDQVTALALAMSAGEEADIIATANLSNVSELGLAHSLIAERGRAKMQREWSPRDAQKAKNEAYYQSTKSMWIESLGVFVLGRMW